MAFQDRLSTTTGRLTPAERRTVTVLLQEPSDILFLSASGLAARAHVHESTVIRLAQKLGYDGYASLRAELREQAHQVDVSARASAREHKGHQLAKLVEDESRALLAMVDTIGQDRLEAVAKTLVDARRVFVHGTPILVMSLEKRLRRLGLDVVSLPSDSSDIPEKLLSLRNSDVLFAFVLREPTPVVKSLTEYAQLHGATVVIVSDVPGVKLPVVPQHLIIALRGADSTFRTMTVPIVFCYALELAIYHLAQPEASDALVQLSSIAATLNARHQTEELSTDQ